MNARNPLWQLAWSAGLAVLTLWLLAGCVVTQKASRQMAELANLAKGEYYLKRGKYQSGITDLEQEVRENPRDADLFYYLGRYHMALDHVAPAGRYFNHAVKLEPDNADYCFWQGVAQGAVGEKRRERQTYGRCLELDPDHPQVLIYLGNNLLQAKQYQGALDMYRRALDQTPANPQVLYNRAYAMNRLQRTPEAIAAWKIYLAYYPAGQLALRAVRHLNRLGDFDYRVYLIGRRRLVMPRIGFYPLTAQIEPVVKARLDSVARILLKNPQLVLQILAFQKNNLPLAKARAQEIKRVLLDRYPAIDAQRIQVSWFKVPQELPVRDGKRRLESSIHLFTTH